jgi:lipopolysaccharide transport system permease protein
MVPIFIRQLVAYRRFILQSVIDDYKKRYARSKFALLWTVLHPVVQVVVFAIVFSSLLGARLPGNAGPYAFSVYMLSGVLVWGLFADTLTRMTTVFVEYGSQIKKIVFPKSLPVAIAIGIAATNFLILLAVTLVFLSLIGNFPGWHLVELIPYALCAIMLGAGLGLMLGTLNVFMRDIGQVVTIVMTFWFWLTPIVYQASQLPPGVKAYVDANPISPLTTAFQRVMLTNAATDFSSLAFPVACAAVLCSIGVFMLYRSAPQMADAL